MARAATGIVPEDWPNASASRIIQGPHHRWHVQQMGDGPDVLLLHGAGGSVHSYADLLPRLAQNFRVFAPDLPGHGYSKRGAQRRSGLQQMAEDIAALCAQEDVNPIGIVAHSAGGAVALTLARTYPHARIVGINPALSRFEGLAGMLFPAMAKLLAAVPFTSHLFSSASSNPKRIKDLMNSTGSQLTEAQIDLYRRLVGRQEHVNGTLAMMAQWNLDPLVAELPKITSPALFVTGRNDMTVPPRVAEEAALQMPHAAVTCLDGYGHLIHEEAPDDIAALCFNFLTQETTKAAL